MQGSSARSEEPRNDLLIDIGVACTSDRLRSTIKNAWPGWLTLGQTIMS